MGQLLVQCGRQKQGFPAQELIGPGPRATFWVLFARGAMVARQVLTLKIEVRVLAGEPTLTHPKLDNLPEYLPPPGKSPFSRKG